MPAHVPSAAVPTAFGETLWSLDDTESVQMLRRDSATNLAARRTGPQTALVSPDQILRVVNQLGFCL